MRSPKSKPAALFEPSLAALITPGTFDDDLPKLAECDWVIEAVAENLEIKTALLARVVPHLAAARASHHQHLRPAHRAHRRGHSQRIGSRFFGTHFFNPPRYMRLLEVIPTPETDPACVAAFAAFADRILGKQVVFANDTPNFIANRIGIAVMFTAANLMLEQGLTIEEVDALTGPALGWPRTGTFRLADLVGIDILAHVAANFPQGVTGGKFCCRPRRDAEARLARRQIRPGLLQENRRGADRPGKTSAWSSISPPSSTAPQRSPRCPRSKWRRTPPPCASACTCCSPTTRERQSRGLPVAVSGLALELRRRPHRRSRRRRAFHRRRHARRLQLGAGPF